MPTEAAPGHALLPMNMMELAFWLGALLVVVVVGWILSVVFAVRVPVAIVLTKKRVTWTLPSPVRATSAVPSAKTSGA